MRLAFTPFLAVIFALGGCATTSTFNQKFLEARTDHFDIISALGEDETRELARQLENFHLGARVVLGASDAPNRFERIRVIAFDGRSLGRPFAIRGEGAYFLPAAEGGTLVIRAGGGWDRRVGRDLLHQIAHRLLRSQFQNRMPLWLEEGFAQAIGATRTVGDRVRVGGLIPEFVEEVTDWKRASVRSVIRVSDLSGEPRSARELFEARAWSLVHVLRFDPRYDRGEGLRAYADALGQGRFRSAEREAALFGEDPERLAERIYDYFTQQQFRVEVVSSVDGRAAGPLRPVSQSRSLTELGWLALRIDQPKLARDYFERAVGLEPDRAEALAGLAQAETGELDGVADSFEPIRKRVHRADLLAPDDAIVQARLGDVYLAAADFSVDDEERQRRIESARRHYHRSNALDPSGVRAQVGLGLSGLASDEATDQGVEWLDAAASLRPGSLGIELDLAGLERKRGRFVEARARARAVLSRSHDEPLRERARALLEEMESSEQD